jgi:hypothetical protein
VSKKKSRFAIGQNVTVTAKCLTVTSNEGIRTAKSCPCTPFDGLIVGARYRMLGKYESGNQFSEDGYQPPYLAVKGCVMVWLVARSMMGRPVEVLDADVHFSQSQEWPPNLPWYFASVKQEYSAEYRRFLADAAKDMDRDAKGRFVKTPSPHSQPK